MATTKKLKAPAVPTSPENKARIEMMYVALQPRMEYLSGRWADESEYEDIAEYKQNIEKLLQHLVETGRGFALPEGFAITKMTKRPFGFQFKIGEAEYAIFCSARQYGWQRVK